MKYLLDKKQINVQLREKQMLDSDCLWIIKRIYKMDRYIIVYSKGNVFINPEVKEHKQLLVLVEKLFKYRYLNRYTEKIYEEVEKITDEQTASVLHLHIWHEWRKEIIQLELYEKAKEILRQTRKNRLFYKARKNVDIIQELYSIGFGVYDEKCECNKYQGLENVFMYGYWLGTQKSQVANNP